jgi:hypothetical protein
MGLSGRSMPAKVGKDHRIVDHISVGNVGEPLTWKDMFDGFEGVEVIIRIDVRERKEKDTEG